MIKVRFAVIAVYIIGLYSCGNAPTATATASVPAVSDSIKAASQPESKKSDSSSFDWHYSNEIDKMTSKQMYFAKIDATEDLKLKFPYEGGSMPSILVRRKNGETNVILGVTKGQFMTGMEGETIKVRFDESPAEDFHCAGSNDQDSRYLFIDQATRFVKRLKTSKKMLIQVEMYDNGIQIMEFNTIGFVADNFLSREGLAPRRHPKSDDDVAPEDPAHPLVPVSPGVH